MGASDSYTDTIEVTLSTRTLIRWADLTLRFQPLAHQGIQPLSYALNRALGFRASRPTRAMLHELLQRMFPMDCHLGERKRLRQPRWSNGCPPFSGIWRPTPATSPRFLSFRRLF